MKMTRGFLLVFATAALLGVDAFAQTPGPTATPQQKFKCSGTVIDGAGRPLAGATVDYWRLAGNGHGGAAFYLIKQITTKRNGAFEFQLSRAAGVLLARKSGLAPAWVPWGSGHDREEHLALTPPTAVAGVVVNEADKPVANAEVSAVIADIPAEIALAYFSARTDAAGRFRIKNLPTNDIAWNVESPGKALRPPKQNSARAEGEDIKLVVEPVGSIEGKVIVEGSNEPPPAACLRLQSHDHGCWNNVRAPMLSAVDGAFQFSDVAAGSYRIYAQIGTNTVSEWIDDAVPVSIEPGQPASVRVTAVRGGWLEVTALGEKDRKPQAKIGIRAYKQNLRSLSSFTDSDSNGIARLWLAPGEYQLLGSHDYMNVKAISARVEDGKTNRVEMEIPPPKKPISAGPPSVAGPINATHFVPAGAKVTLEVDRHEYFIGENVPVNFILENTGDQPFVAEFGGDYRFASRSTRFKVTATDEQGKTAEDPDPLPMCWGGRLDRRPLQPGEKFTQSLPLLRYCEIVRPGRYTIRVTHDFGWAEGDRKRPVGETTITFRMPTPVEADAVIAAMEKSHDDAGFTGLCLPIYLEPLMRQAREGDRLAIEGISRMATQDATAALIELATNSDAELAFTAAQALNARLPDPALESANGFGGYGPFSKEVRRRLVTNSWDAKFAPAVRSLATNFLAQPQTAEINAGAFMVRIVGTPAEANAVVSALGRALGPMYGPRRDSKEDIVNQPEPLRELISAMNVLHKQGYTIQEGEGANYIPVASGVEWDRQGRCVVGTALNGEAKTLLYFTWLAGTPGPRSARWLELVKAYGPSTRFPTRVAILNSMPQPLPDRCVAFVESRLEDADFGVCRAACAIAGQSGRKDFLKPMLDIVATEHHESLLREATDDAKKLGAGFNLLDVWADRLAEEGLCGVALDNLQSVIDGLPGNTTGGNLTRAERIELRDQWKNFLARHAVEIRLGKKFKLDDPALTPALFGRARTFHLPNGKTWPVVPSGMY